MPTGFLKPLTLGKCLEDLKPKYDIDIECDAKRLCRTAPKLFKSAEENRLHGDEERSYILYMKYLSVVERVRALRKKDSNAKKYFDELDKNEMIEAIDHAEKLCASLQERYKELQEKEAAERLEKKLKEKESDKRKLNVPEKAGSSSDTVNGFADASGKFINCAKLFTLLDKSKNILIMDVRSILSFNESHLKSDCVINIPEDIVKPGITSSTLEKKLPSSSKPLWNQRGIVDLVILVDWSTSAGKLDPGSTISVLRDILLKWDVDVSYKKPPLILDGGYEEWLLRYPVLTTNPHPTSMPSLQRFSSTDFLNDIVYPTIPENLEFSQPNIDRSSKPVSNSSSINSGFSSSSMYSSSNIGVPPVPPVSIPTTNTYTPVSPKPHVPSNPSVTSRPSIDRSSKAAAVITYEERSQAVQKLLRQKEKVTEATLKLEQNRQEMEDERERIRMRREMEAEEEMRKELQEREEQLLKNIMDLERLQVVKDKENQALRDELEEYKRREQEDTLPKEYSAFKQQEDAINARIRSSEEQRRKIMEDREKKSQILKSDQHKKLGMGEGVNANQPVPDNLQTYKERERIAREKLLQDRLQREKQKQGKQEHDQIHNKSLDADDRGKRRGMENANGSEPFVKPAVNGKPTPPPKSRLDPDKGSYTAPLKDTPSGIMKRSHSSPNIAQMDDEELNGRGKPFKTHHPSELRFTRQRNFSPVYGDMGRGLTGLKNLGNTCYMNSIIQCLSNTTPLARYFVSGEYRNDINRQTETRGEIAEEVAAVVRALWSSSYKCIATRDLRSVVGKHRDQFQTNQQQDSNEFLTILMDWLHEDLKKPSIKMNGQNTGREQTDWEKQWDEFYKENSSLIVFLFYGQQKSTVRCLRCNEESVRYETFSNLTLPLPPNSNNGAQHCSLEDCVQLYVKGERISGWKCPVCKDHRDAMKKFDIIKLPPILIIHFKRFYMEGWCRKRQTFVRFPLKDWDMRRYTLFPEQKYTNYDLYGVSNHYGTMEGGHYTAYCKSVEHRKWYKFDDNEVSEISSSEVQSGAAYILFYASINFQVPDIS